MLKVKKDFIRFLHSCGIYEEFYYTLTNTSAFAHPHALKRFFDVVPPTCFFHFMHNGNCDYEDMKRITNHWRDYNLKWQLFLIQLNYILDKNAVWNEICIIFNRSRIGEISDDLLLETQKLLYTCTSLYASRTVKDYAKRSESLRKRQILKNNEGIFDDDDDYEWTIDGDY